MLLYSVQLLNIKYGNYTAITVRMCILNIVCSDLAMAESVKEGAMTESVDEGATNVVPTTLTNPEVLRYGRQMIVDGIGLPGQEGLKKSKVSFY